MMLVRLHKWLLFGILLLLPTQLSYHPWPEWSLVLGRRVDYLSPSLFITDILMVSTIFVWFLSRFNPKTVTPQITKLPGDFLVILFVVLVFVIANIRMSLTPQIALLTWVRIGVLIVFMISLIRTRLETRMIVISLSFAMLYSTLIAFGQVFRQQSIGGALYLLGERQFTSATPGIALQELCGLGPYCFEHLRPYGTLPHPNVLGGFLATLLPVAFISYRKEIISWQKKLYGLLLALSVIALILTFSFSAWIGSLAGFLAMVLLASPRKSLVKVAVVGLVMLIGVSSLLLFLSFYFKPDSLKDRISLLIAGYRMWHHSPIVGIGWFNSLVLLPQYQLDRSLFFLQPVHNIYVLMLVEIGVVGFTAIILLTKKLIITPLLWVWKLRRKLIIIHPHAHAYFASIVVMGILGLFDHYLITTHQGRLLLAVCVSLLIKSYQIKYQK